MIKRVLLIVTIDKIGGDGKYMYIYSLKKKLHLQSY